MTTCDHNDVRLSVDRYLLIPQASLPQAHGHNIHTVRKEVALLLSSMPTQLKMIATLIELFKNPPPGIAPIQV